MAISRLVYYSETRELGSGGVGAILDVARRNNARRGVTGVLLFNRNYFLQCLEGARHDVTATFCRIAADARHGNVALVSVQDIEMRAFPDWTMGLVQSTSPEVTSTLREYLPTDEFHPHLLSSSSAVELMRRMREMDRTTR